MWRTNGFLLFLSTSTSGVLIYEQHLPGTFLIFLWPLNGVFKFSNKYHIREICIFANSKTIKHIQPFNSFTSTNIHDYELYYEWNANSRSCLQTTRDHFVLAKQRNLFSFYCFLYSLKIENDAHLYCSHCVAISLAQHELEWIKGLNAKHEVK